MNASEFVKYLDSHGGKALVGNPETLDVARQMEEKGLLAQMGSKRGKPWFQVTEKGQAFLDYSIKKLPGTTTHKATKTAKTLLGFFQDYATAFKDENPVGMEDIRRAAGSFGAMRTGSDLPDIAPMQLDSPRPKQLPNKKAKIKEKDSEYIVIDGKKYRKVD